jgi:hypothetical protein
MLDIIGAGLYLLNGVTSTGAGSTHQLSKPKKTFQASGSTTAGAGAATIKIQVSNDNVNWLDMGTISLTLSTSVTSDGFSSDSAWTYVRANLSALSGTGASVTVTVGAGH